MVAMHVHVLLAGTQTDGHYIVSWEENGKFE